MSQQKHGRPEEELFISRPAATPEESTVAPLRINKASTFSSSTSPPRVPSAGSQAGALPTFPAPTSKPPSGPLPYPDSRSGSANPPYPTPNAPPASTTPDSSSGRRRASASQGVGSPRAKFSANDPNRPTAAGYASNMSHGSGQSASVGERRGNVPTSLSPSSGPPTNVPVGPDSSKDGLFQRAPGRTGPADANDQHRPSEEGINPFPDYHQQYWPPPSAGGSVPPAKSGGLTIPDPGGAGIGRMDSTASVMTTRAQRGSPPPPETPIIPPTGGGIEARYAAAGIGGPPSTAGASSAAAARAAQYPGLPRPSAGSTATPGLPQTGAQPPRRPWTPTEAPGSQPHGPPAVYQGMNEVPPSTSPPSVSSPPSTASGISQNRPGEHALEHDFSRMNVGEEPPPAYHTVTNGATTAQGYPNEKGRSAAAANIAQPTPAAPSASTAAAANQGHPAFANDPRVQSGASPSPVQSSASTAVTSTAAIQNSSPPPPGAGPASPPPLPEGWIAHLDAKSGQYYYIHLPTQSTQWEFPKGPTPLNLTEPMSPTGTIVSPTASTFKQPLASPGFPVQQTATFRPDTYLSMSSIATPTAAGFTGPPPTAGVETYKVAPTNGVYFGPYLRYTNMDIERGIWLGSILLVTDAPQPPTIHIHQSVDLSPNPRQLKPNPIYSHQRWMFYRYDVDLKMDDQSSKWTYAVTSHLGCTRYEFVIAGRYETSWRFIAHSGNDFALNVNANERNRLGGVGYMWKDILQKHIECNGFHVQLGLGDQIYADRMWKELPLLRQWTAMSGKDNRKTATWTPQHEDEITHAYFHYYTSHFDQPHIREAFAQIPNVLSVDDHDIFDGFGSYPEYMQFSNMFKNIGRIGIEMYLLFQHHTTLDILRNVNNDLDLFTITGTGWHFIKYLGPSVVVVGPDTRSERNPHQVMAGPTYQGLFPKLAVLPQSVQHCILMIPVPLIYPRMDSMEHLASTVATGKKAATGAFNMLGKVTSSVAGVVGAKEVVGEGFASVKKAVGKSGLMSSVINPFGEIGPIDELRDQWTHESKDLERTYLIRTLQGIAHNKSLRMTFFSGQVNACGAGLVHDPSKPQDHKTMYQIITSAVVNAPPSTYMLKLLHSNKPLYVPANGHRSTHTPSDTKEDMMEIFGQDVNGQQRELKRLMGRRNYVACVAFDPEVVNQGFGSGPGGSQGQGKLSLAIDFMVQGDGGYGGAVRYGPVIIPSLEFGR